MCIKKCEKCGSTNLFEVKSTDRDDWTNQIIEQSYIACDCGHLEIKKSK